MNRTALVLLLVGLACLPAWAAGKEQPTRTLAVTGTAEVTVTPDICYMSFSGESRDPKSAGQAYADNSRLMNAVKAAVRAAGIEDKDIQTGSFSIAPQYRYDSKTSKRIFEGYLVHHTLTVKVRDLARVSAVLDAAVGAGATEVSYVNFTVENPKRYTADARVEALGAARAKAERICEVTGMRLGKPISISESEPGSYGYYYAQANVSDYRDQVSAGESGVPLTAGSTKLTHTVHITYEIE